MNVNIDDTLSMLQDVKLGLQTLEDEEENLMILKSHLTKIKKIKEDQIRKDDLIVTLKERIAILENEQTALNRQHYNMEEILTERISILENSVKDKNQFEVTCSELNETVQTLTVQNSTLSAELDKERSKVSKNMAHISKKEDEILILQAEIITHQDTIKQLQTYFDALRVELSNKEQHIAVQSKKHKELVSLWKKEDAIAKQTISDMAGQLVICDETNKKQDDVAINARRDIEQLRAEVTARRSELELWKDLNKEQESLLLAAKAQIATTQEKFTNEINSLRFDLAKSRKETQSCRAELKQVQHILSSITHDMKIISSFETQHNNANSGSNSRKTTQRAEIIALALSMKRSTASLSQTDDDDQLSSVSVHINEDVQNIVSFVCDLIHRVVAYQEEGTHLEHQLHQRSEAVSSTSTLFTKLEDKYANSKHELAAVDNTVKELVFRLQQCFKVKLDEPLVTRSVNSFLPNGKAAKSTPKKGKEQLNQHTLDIKSESRASTFDHLLRLIESATVCSTETVPLLQEQIVAEKRRAKQELEVLMEEHEHTLNRLNLQYSENQQRLLEEIQILRKENDDALIAVNVTNYETKMDMIRTREQYRHQLTDDHKDLVIENEELQSSLRTCMERYQSVTLCLEHLLQHITPMHDKYTSLQNAYHLLYDNWFSRANLLIEGVHALSQCCHNIDNNVTHHEHHLFPSSPPSNEVVVQGRVTNRRPHASSRDQRINHLRERHEHHIPDSKHRGGYPNPRRLTLRIVALYVLAANRFLHFRYKSRLDTSISNLVAVAAAQTVGVDGCNTDAFLHDFLVCYPAFTIPSTEDLLVSSSKRIAEQLLSSAAISHTSSGSLSLKSASLLETVKVRPSSYSARNTPTKTNINLFCHRDLEHVQLTLLDVCEKIRLIRAGDEKSQATIASLEARLDELQEELYSAALVEQKQRDRIDQLERERRFGSLTILRDIHNELRDHDDHVQHDSEERKTLIRDATQQRDAQRVFADSHASRYTSTDMSMDDSFDGYSSNWKTATGDRNSRRQEDSTMDEDVNNAMNESQGVDNSELDATQNSDYEDSNSRGMTKDNSRSQQRWNEEKYEEVDAHSAPSRSTTNSNPRWFKDKESSLSIGRYNKNTTASSSSTTSTSVINSNKDVAQRASVSDRRGQHAEALREMIHDSSVVRRSLNASGVDSSFEANNTSVSTVDSGSRQIKRDRNDIVTSSDNHNHVRSPGVNTSLNSRDDDILEIYSDIGRLTGRLENRLRASPYSNSNSNRNSPDYKRHQQ